MNRCDGIDEHDWVYEPDVKASNPPSRRRICRECGVVQYVLLEPLETSEFTRLLKRFSRMGDQRHVGN